MTLDEIRAKIAAQQVKNGSKYEVAPELVFREDVKVDPLATRITPIMPNRIYFAGKVSKHCWRTDIVNDQRIAYDNETLLAPDIRFTRYNFKYAGPFFRSCDHGCSHNPTSHGAGDGCNTNYRLTRDFVFGEALLAIKTADTVFVWLGKTFNGAYGTLAEVGFAYARDKNIVLALHDDFDEPDELWFVAKMANSIIHAPSAAMAFDRYIAHCAIRRNIKGK